MVLLNLFSALHTQSFFVCFFFEVLLPPHTIIVHNILLSILQELIEQVLNVLDEFNFESVDSSTVQTAPLNFAIDDICDLQADFLLYSSPHDPHFDNCPCRVSDILPYHLFLLLISFYVGFLLLYFIFLSQVETFP